MTDPRKPIFDAVRAASRPGLFNDPGNILALDNLLDAFDVPRAGQTPKAMRTADRGIALMKEFEGYARVISGGRVQAYPDPGTGGEPWTIGFGSTGVDPFNGGRINRNTIWTDAQAETRFRQHLAEFERVVNGAVTAPMTQNQFDAMVSLTYNIGPGAPNAVPIIHGFLTSTVLREHNAGRTRKAADAFLMWNRAGGRVMAGLTRRRQAERELYLS